MSLLDDLHHNQHDEISTPADAALSAFLASVDYQSARLDLAPQTSVEARMLSRLESKRTH